MARKRGDYRRDVLTCAKLNGQGFLEVKFTKYRTCAWGNPGEEERHSRPWQAKGIFTEKSRC